MSNELQENEVENASQPRTLTTTRNWFGDADTVTHGVQYLVPSRAVVGAQNVRLVWVNVYAARFSSLCLG
jgi:hypothetical protein